MIADFETKKEDERAKVASDIEGAWSELDPEATGFCTVETFAMIYESAKKKGQLRDMCGPDVDIDDINAVFSHLDTNKNGKLEKAEVIAMYGALMVRMLEKENEKKIESLKEELEEGLDAWYREFDTGTKGYMDKDDFRKFHDEGMRRNNFDQSMLLLVDYTDFEAFFSYFDTNGNGKIEREEAIKVQLRIRCVSDGIPPPM